MSNSLTVLGSASGLPSATRACSGYLLTVNNSLSLIDCGGGVVASFLKLGFDPHRLDRVFISHTHSDHVGDLALLIQLLHGVNSYRRLDIYLPESFVEIYRAYLTGVYLVPERLKSDPVLHGYRDGFEFENGFRLRAVANNHLSSIVEDFRRLELPHDFQCHSFRMEIGDSTVFYTADIDGFADARPHLQNLDLVLIEGTHIEFPELLSFTRDASVRQWVVTHVSDQDIEPLQSLIDRAGVPNVRVAYDGLVLPL
ncbi:MAG: MBL fold metallo-hydrolase [candidate division Zixibacteria bacterium]|nr:MBL fold metallo-hydrolase [candidate division Zixibacteria bacterium]